MKNKGSWIDRLERKIGKYAIPDLMKYLSIMYIIGLILCMTGIYDVVLSLDFNKIFHGQIWRLITFVVYPPQLITGSALSLIFAIISISLYFMIGRSLENAWGTFRYVKWFNLIFSVWRYWIYYDNRLCISDNVFSFCSYFSRC